MINKNKETRAREWPNLLKIYKISSRPLLAMIPVLGW